MQGLRASHGFNLLLGIGGSMDEGIFFDMIDIVLCIGNVVLLRWHLEGLDG